MKRIVYLFIFLLFHICVTDIYPENSVFQKAGIGLVRIYQEEISPLRLEKGTCRFTPTCSNYALQSVGKYGLLAGTLMTADRIQRCNPVGEWGEDYCDSHYIFASNSTAASTNTGSAVRTKSPALAGVLSIIPGLGKIYCGKTKDGIYSFVFISVLGYLTYDTYTKGAYSSSLIWGSSFVTFYLGNIYGSVDAAKNEKK
jgi:uncharacterized protein